MQVVPLVQLSWDRAHSSMSAKQGQAVGQAHQRAQTDPVEGFLLMEIRQKNLEKGQTSNMIKKVCEYG